MLIAETIRVGRVCEKILVLTRAGLTQGFSRRVSQFSTRTWRICTHFSTTKRSTSAAERGTSRASSRDWPESGSATASLPSSTTTTRAVQANEVRKLNLPDNFRILTLPDLKFAKRYPTVGPNGTLNRHQWLRMWHRTLPRHGSTHRRRWLADTRAVGRLRSKGQTISGRAHRQEGCRRTVSQITDGPDLPNEDNLASMRAVLQMMFTAFA